MPDDTTGDAGPPPGLDQLFGALTAAPAARELAGESAALEMFRASRLPAVPRHRPVIRPRMLAAAAVIILIAGFAGAAYGSALPAPVQHVAYRVLGFIGVPNSGGGDSGHSRHGSAGQPSSLSPSQPGKHPVPASGSPSPNPGPSSGSATHPSSAGSPSPTGKQSSSPSPSPSGKQSSSPAPPTDVALSATAASSLISAGGDDQITGTLTSHGKALAGQQVTLQRHLHGHPGWQPDGQATSAKDGQVSLPVTDLTTNLAFRLAGPVGALSAPVLVRVIPQLSARLVIGAQDAKARLTVSTQYAVAGDIVLLKKLILGVWETVQTGRLGAAGKHVFVIQVPPNHSRRFRVVLLSTVVHAKAGYGPVIVPRRRR